MKLVISALLAACACITHAEPAGGPRPKSATPPKRNVSRVFVKDERGEIMPRNSCRVVAEYRNLNGLPDIAEQLNSKGTDDRPFAQFDLLKRIDRDEWLWITVEEAGRERFSLPVGIDYGNDITVFLRKADKPLPPVPVQ